MPPSLLVHLQMDCDFTMIMSLEPEFLQIWVVPIINAFIEDFKRLSCLKEDRTNLPMQEIHISSLNKIPISKEMVTYTRLKGSTLISTHLLVILTSNRTKMLIDQIFVPNFEQQRQTTFQNRSWFEDLVILD